MTNEKLRQIFESVWPGFLTFEETDKSNKKEISAENLMNALKNAYDAGFKAKKCKEDKEDPYHIDPKRQTKIEF